MIENGYDIRRLTRKEINVSKWDNCISRSFNGLIYARSFYLDMMAKNWDALVLNDYEAVMPLCWNRKYGIRYLYQPPFTPQLGIFMSVPDTDSLVSPLLVEAFLAQAAHHFHFTEIFLNYANAHPQLTPHANFTLSLNAPYEQLAGQYKRDLLKNLKAANRFSLSYITTHDLKETLAFHKNLYHRQMMHIKRNGYDRFERLCRFLQQHGQLLLRSVSGSRQEVLATALLPREKNRIYLLQSSVSPAGRSAEANHFLMDQLIREFSGQALILDFEGSQKPGIAHFYRNFGAINQPRYFYRNNQLPWPLQIVKPR